VISFPVFSVVFFSLICSTFLPHVYCNCRDHSSRRGFFTLSLWQSIHSFILSYLFYFVKKM
jgi:hypothetical protein